MGNESIDFTKYLAPNLNLLSRAKNIDGSVYNCCRNERWISCGSATLGLLTNSDPCKHDKYLSKFNDPNDGWHTGIFVKRLNELGYSTLELTPELIARSSNSKAGWRNDMPINQNHCLVLNAQLDKNDNTYFIYFGGRLFHHLHTHPYNSHFFINKPIQDTILVWHPKWKA